MVYLISDLHGYPVGKFKALLARAGFSEGDTLYVLGDIIDRGTDGVRLLQYMLEQPNVKPILGNHEQMMLACAFLFEKETGYLGMEQRRIWSEWRANGGSPTIEALRELHPSDRRALFEYVRSFPLYREVSAGGREYVLTHSGISRFQPDKPLTEYEANDFLWHRPKLRERYYDGKTVVLGHTPTFVFGGAYAGKPFKTETWVDIDAGVSSGFPPLLIRLEDRKYFTN